MDTSGKKGESYLTQYLKYKFFILGSVILCVFLAFIYLNNTIPEYRINARAKVDHDGPIGSNEIDKQIQHIRAITLEKTIIQTTSINNSFNYSQNLVIASEHADKKYLVLSLLESDRQRGITFINQLVKNYNIENGIPTPSKVIVNPHIQDSLSLIEHAIDALKQKIDLLKKRPLSTPKPKVEIVRKKISDRAALQLKLLDVLLPYLKNPASQFALIPYADEITNPEIQELVLHFNGLQSDKQSKLKDLKETDPVIETINKKLVFLAQNIKEKIEIQEVAIKGSGILEVIQKTETKKPNPVAGELLILEKSIQSRLGDKSRLTNKQYFQPVFYSENQIKLVLLGPPDSPAEPEYPKQGFTYMLAVVIGLLIPGVFPFITIKVRKTVRNDVNGLSDIKRLTRTPLYGTYRLDGNLNSGSSAHPDPVVAIANHLNVNKPGQTIVVTSANEVIEQVSFSKFLGQKLAKGKKTVLVDFNFKEPHLMESFGLVGNTGVVNYIENKEISVDSLLTSSENKMLYLIGVGHMQENADPISSFFKSNDLASPWADETKLDELINHPRVSSLLRELRSKFDYILLDAPSINNPADLFPLIPFSDLEVITLSQTKALKTELKSIDGLIERKRFRNPVIFYLG